MAISLQLGKYAKTVTVADMKAAQYMTAFYKRLVRANIWGADCNGVFYALPKMSETKPPYICVTLCGVSPFYDCFSNFWITVTTLSEAEVREGIAKERITEEEARKQAYLMLNLIAETKALPELDEADLNKYPEGLREDIAEHRQQELNREYREAGVHFQRYKEALTAEGWNTEGFVVPKQR